MMQHESARNTMIADRRLNLAFVTSRITGEAVITDVGVMLPQPENQPLMACVEFAGCSELLIDGKNGFAVEFADGGRLEYRQTKNDG